MVASVKVTVRGCISVKVVEIIKHVCFCQTKLVGVSTHNCFGGKNGLVCTLDQAAIEGIYGRRCQCI